MDWVSLYSHTVFFVGLFAQDYGRQQNLPVARFGQISRMPIEPVTFKYPGGVTTKALAYLVECRSWGGHSGSPVLQAGRDRAAGRV